MEKIAEWFDYRINPIVGKFTGFRIIRNFPKMDEVRDSLINKLNIEIAIDGGANCGQWATRLRRNNKKIKIFSFEPVSEPFKVLKKNSSKDKDWSVFNFALGDLEENREIHLSNNGNMSSSIFLPTRHKEDFPSVKFEGTETIQIKSLDSIDLGSSNSNILLKLDVQGFEIKALKGAEKILTRVALIEIETAFHSMYEGELRHSEIIKWLEDKNFEIYSIGQPSIGPNGRAGYLDCLLINSSIAG